MKISSRELLLGWTTLVVLVLGLTYWFIQPRFRQWSELGKQRQLAQGRHALADRLLEQKPGLDERMEVLRKKVPSYSPDKDVTSDYLKIIEQLAKDSDLSLIQRRPDKEKLPKQGRLYELAMDCTWESDLAALLRFLAGLEAQSQVAMDIRDLTVSPIPGKKGRLKGNFAIVCMYTRTGDAAKTGSPASSPTVAPAPAAPATTGTPVPSAPSATAAPRVPAPLPVPAATSAPPASPAGVSLPGRAAPGPVE